MKEGRAYAIRGHIQIRMHQQTKTVRKNEERTRERKKLGHVRGMVRACECGWGLWSKAAQRQRPARALGPRELPS